MTSLRINGQSLDVTAEPDTPLLWLLRSALGLTGTKFGCGIGACGACNLHLDGVPARACVTPLSAAIGKEITTIEGLQGVQADALRRAWQALEVVQCGYCQSGQLMSACALLRSNPTPTDPQIDAAMAGNLCRCGTYPRIRAAIHHAAVSLK